MFVGKFFLKVVYACMLLVSLHVELILEALDDLCLVATCLRQFGLESGNLFAQRSPFCLACLQVTTYFLEACLELSGASKT